MSFKEYPSIENTYQSKEIEWLLRNRPESTKYLWVAEEKINGSNMQINVTFDGQVTYGSRNRLLPDDEDHYGFKVWCKDRFIVQINKLKRLASDSTSNIRVYGEFFGPKICKGVDYGKEKRFIIFGLMFDELFQNPVDLYAIMKCYGLEEWCIKPEKIGSFQEILDHNPRFISHYSPTQDLAEGLVLKPYNIRILDQNGLPIYYKNKIDEFKDKQRAPSEKVQNDPAKGVLLDYWNENRLNSCYSKVGKIASKTQIGIYLKHIMDDICADWQKENGDLELESKEKGILSPQIAKRLLQDL